MSIFILIDNISITEIDASSGAILITKRTTDLNYYPDVWTMSITSDDTSIYFTAIKNSSVDPVVWKLQISTWVIITNKNRYKVFFHFLLVLF